MTTIDNKNKRNTYVQNNTKIYKYRREQIKSNAIL